VGEVELPFISFYFFFDSSNHLNTAESSTYQQLRDEKDASIKINPTLPHTGRNSNSSSFTSKNSLKCQTKERK